MNVPASELVDNINEELAIRTRGLIKLSPELVVVLSGYSIGEIVGNAVWYKYRVSKAGTILEIDMKVQDWLDRLEPITDSISMLVPFDGYEKSTYKAIEEVVNEEICFGGDHGLDRHATRRYEEDGEAWGIRRITMDIDEAMRDWYKTYQPACDVATQLRSAMVVAIEDCSSYPEIKEIINDSVGVFLEEIKELGLIAPYELIKTFRESFWSACDRSEWKKGRGIGREEYDSVKAALDKVKGDVTKAIMTGKTEVNPEEVSLALTHVRKNWKKKFDPKVYRALDLIKK